MTYTAQVPRDDLHFILHLNPLIPRPSPSHPYPLWKMQSFRPEIILDFGPDRNFPPTRPFTKSLDEISGASGKCSSIFSWICLPLPPPFQIKLGGPQGRIQEFILGGAKPRSPIESWGRSPNRGREAPNYRGRSPSRGREAPENWGRSPNRGRSPRKSRGEGVWGGGSVSPSPENFWKIELETIHFGAYLKQLFEMTNKMVRLSLSGKIISNYLMWRKKRGTGLGRGLSEPLPRKFLKNQFWNHSFWCIFEAIIWND